MASTTPTTKPDTLFPKIGFSAGFTVAYQKYQKSFPGKRPPNTVELVGSIKLHGTHADLIVYPDNTIHFQSRNRLLDLQNDNHDFVKTMSPLRNEILAIRDRYTQIYTANTKMSVDPKYPIIIAGEWVGPKIQAGVALSKLKKNLFVIVSCKINGAWVPDLFFQNIHNEAVGIYNISKVSFRVEEIDVWNPAPFKELMKDITLKVEKQCPFGKELGLVGLGEGVVWKPKDPALAADPKYWFKDKGEEHRNPTTDDLVQNKSARKADLKTKAKMFAERALKESRMEQAWDYLREMGITRDKAGVEEFNKWLCKDVLTEEKTQIKVMQVEVNMLRNAIGVIGTQWYMDKLEGKIGKQV